MKPLFLISMTILAAATSITAKDSPKSLGYIFPDEWEEHRGTMMIFPAKHSYGLETKGLRREFIDIAQAIAKNEPVEVFCLANEAAECRELLGAIENVAIHAGDFRIDWARDNAPMVLRQPNGKLASAGFRFNGWGKKYEGWEADVDTRNKISEAMDWPIFHSDLVLLDPITDGHVDGLLKFIAKDTVLLHTTDLKTDVNYSICQDAKRVLLANSLKVIELPLMDDIVHMNYYIGSGGTVAYVPICGDPEQDEPALKHIRKLYEHVIPILSNNLAKAGGGIHCYTQQIPK